MFTLSRTAPALTAVALVLAPAAAHAAQGLFVDVPRLEALMARRGGLVILDARVGEAFRAGHIPGAVNATWNRFAVLEGKRPGDRGFGTLLSPGPLGAAIASVGVDESKAVVVYADASGRSAGDGRVAWSLRAAGLDRVHILEGGFAAWRAAGRRVERGTSAATVTAFTVRRPDPSLTISTAELALSLGRVKVVDARTADEFNGARWFGEARGGRIPGARLLTWDRVFDPAGRLRPRGELRRLFAAAGVSPGDEIVVYCTKGARSAHLTLVLRDAGFTRARNYDGSFYEWAADPSLPVE